MAKHTLWHDEYWLLLMQLYLKRPQGVKPLYSRSLVNLGMELHIPPSYLFRNMLRLRQIDTPRLQQLWDTYGKSPRKLSKEVKLLKQMNGFGNSEDFYAGVEINESWEKDFKPVELVSSSSNEVEERTKACEHTVSTSKEGSKTSLKDKRQTQYTPLTPVKLMMILDLYFRLIPITMVPETPEIISLACLIQSTPQEISDVMQVYKVCDPYLNHKARTMSPLHEPCMQVWKRFGNDNPEKLTALAAQLKDYWK